MSAAVFMVGLVVLAFRLWAVRRMRYLVVLGYAAAKVGLKVDFCML